MVDGTAIVKRTREPYVLPDPELKVWYAMVSRCHGPIDKNSPTYLNYQARGISVCDRWRESYANFIADMGRRPSDNHTLDRINNDGNYEPSNCRWADRKTQSLNRRMTAKNSKKHIYTGSKDPEWTGRPMVRS